MSDTFKQEKLKDFTIIRNSIFKDCRLSAKAKGVACQLLSLPPTWDYSVKGLVTLFDDGEASIRSALSELEEAGYLRREQSRAEGKFSKSIYIITDILKSEKPCVENPLAENSSAGNPAQLNTKVSNTYKSNNKELYISEFERLWEIYPKKQGKKKALDSYIKARKEGTTYEEVEEGIYAYARLIRAERRDEQYIKHGSTFFSQRAWLDDFTVNVTPQNKPSGNPFLDMLKGGMFDD